MDVWTPPDGEPQLLDWWLPLILLGRAAREDQFPWPVYPEEFELGMRVDRKPRPSVWVYRHLRSGGELLVDSEGQPYRFIPTPNGWSVGQFRTCELRRALWAAGLPGVVEPVWYEPPPPRHDWEEPEADGASPGRHLRVVGTD